jgi:hypothetical protein
MLPQLFARSFVLSSASYWCSSLGNRQRDQVFACDNLVEKKSFAELIVNQK